MKRLTIKYSTKFIRMYDALDSNLQKEVKEKIASFSKIENHKLLKVHKLHGRFQDCFAFSVNYKFRIVFEYGGKDTVNLLAVGDHAIYQ